MERHSPDVLRMSIDEASTNLAGTPGLKKLGPEGVGLAIKRAIREEIGECVTASVGVSTSIWMAKQASNLDKRDGLQRIDHRNLVAVFERLQLTDLSGIADATAPRLARGGIHTPVQFLRATAPRLRLAGMHAEVARGWSMRLRGFEVGGFESAKRKSYSHSHVMAHATASQPELEELLMRLSDMVGRRLRAAEPARQHRFGRRRVSARPRTFLEAGKTARAGCDRRRDLPGGAETSCSSGSAADGGNARRRSLVAQRWRGRTARPVRGTHAPAWREARGCGRRDPRQVRRGRRPALASVGPSPGGAGPHRVREYRPP